ncbi:Protein transport protein SecG/Sec61-beta/Sbh - like 1 [Theobroma cacao]|nr:Protein transport protein SecG/Sec61-beta/Sbh - like 1 [Theobroma cacao]
MGLALIGLDYDKDGLGEATFGSGGNCSDGELGLKISPNVVLVMSIGFIAFVAILHVIGK